MPRSIRHVLHLTTLTAAFVGLPGLAFELPERLALDLHGFVDVRGGLRTRDDRYEGDTSLAETRLQLDISRMGDLATIRVRADAIHDSAAEDVNGDLQTGTGVVDLREASVLFSPLAIVDIKLGRQILTWGTGDLVFINDLFPKDWQSFFLGRDDEYLKAPSDAVFVSVFPGPLTIDVAYAPQFDADRFVRGERLSFWNPALGRRSGRDAVVDADLPDEWLRDDETAVRVSGTVGSFELAGYAYHGFWKSPEGQDAATGRAAFPELAVYGASARGAVGQGIANLEIGYYHSQDDRDGDDPLIPNSEGRILAGYERELGRDLTARVQVYLESMDDHGAYCRTQPAGAKQRDRNRHTLTLRLTKQLLNQNLLLSLFLRYSPSDRDVYVRPSVRYKLTDAWLVTAGGNLFFGEDDYTFLGQFETNTNVYAGMRYSF